MLRIAAGVFLGYIAMALIVFAGLTGVYLALGTERTFEPERYAPSVLWLVFHFAVATLAAVAGGVVAAWIGKKPLAVNSLAALVIGLGVLSAVMETTAAKPDPGPRTGDVSNMDAMMKAQQPLWVMFVLPLLGAGGVIAGGRLICGKCPLQSQAG